jgi:hypothetical protein
VLSKQSQVILSTQDFADQEWSNLRVIESLPGGLREIGPPKTIRVDQATEFVSCAGIFKRT